VTAIKGTESYASVTGILIGLVHIWIQKIYILRLGILDVTCV